MYIVYEWMFPKKKKKKMNRTNIFETRIKIKTVKPTFKHTQNNMHIYDIVLYTEIDQKKTRNKKKIFPSRQQIKHSKQQASHCRRQGK